jgi:hypothetical protein
MPESAAARTGEGALLALQQRKKTKRELDLVQAPPRCRLLVAPARREQVGPLVAIARRSTAAPLAPLDVVARVAAAHPETLWVFYRGRDIVGGAALLMLNAAGLRALLADQLDLGDPQPQLLSAPQEKPAAIYNWALLGPSIAAEGIARVIVRLQLPPYANADLYASPVTREGLRLMLGLGFVPVENHPRPLFCYRRIANRREPGRAANRESHAA